MKKLYILFFASCFGVFAQEPATFTVEVPAGTQAVRMTGNFWGWNPIGGPVAISNGLDNTWTVTIFSGGGETQSDFEYLWVITDADGTSNAVQENLIASAAGGDCADRINAGEFNTDNANYANRVFIAAGSDDIKSDVYGSCYLASAPLELKGVIDFTVPSGASDGKALHLYANDDISDLSDYGIGVANNGGGTDGLEYTFPSQSVTAGTHIFLPRSTAAMTAYFVNLNQFDIVIESTVATQNGDDAIELFGNVITSPIVIETFGDIDCAPSADGTTTVCPNYQYYEDAWVYKELGVWTYGAAQCTDGSTTTQSGSCPYPFADATLSNKDFSKSELSIYPGIVTINSTLTEAKNVELFDVMGRTVLKTQLNSDILDVKSLNAGLYLLKVSIDGRTATKKLIIK